MYINKKTAFVLSLFIMMGASLFATTVNSILKEIDAQQDLGRDLTVKMKITQKVVDQGVRTLESLYYRRDSDDSFLIVNLAPESEKGNGYLRTNDNMWIYRRNTRTYQHIGRDESISGTDVTASDFEQRKYSDLYEPAVDENGKEIITEETLGKQKIPVYKFKVVAKVNDVSYPQQILWVRKDNWLVMKNESYSLNGTLMQSTYYLKYTKIGDTYFPLKQIFVDEFEKGNKSVVECSDISLKSISKSIFNKAYLENLSK